jgi:hypothetical protein
MVRTGDSSGVVRRIFNNCLRVQTNGHIIACFWLLQNRTVGSITLH